MLETKNLVKIYKPKKGMPVKALDNVSVTFPTTGMVFLLGKSGSGKSTLLNVLGGLDKYDGGEILIKGVSSKNFKQQHFDSYRNTYVGFIFQEYNVLDEFSVGANIALAIELQNRKATDSEINEILKQVDLVGFGNRKPNELSGGQKQRVAIARALVKNPEIIMADEPTGALDSNTGKQIFDTLKSLSKTKLVIVVSHDREFAEQYADRIIELSDGHIISDMELDRNSENSADNNIAELTYRDNTIEIPNGYHITEQDRKAINEYIEGIKKGNITLSVLNKNGSGKKFVKTDTSAIKKGGSGEFKLIKSKLPMRNAFKIGASGLKYKKIRLVITILLSCIAFGLFGLSDTFGSYNHIKTCTNSLIDSGFKYVSLSKSKKVGGDDGYWRDYGYGISKDEMKQIYEQTGVKMHGVYVSESDNLSFSSQINSDIKLSETDYKIYLPVFDGYTEINEDIIKDMGFTLLAGTLPDGNKNEIAVSEYIYDVFCKAQYFDGTTFTNDEKPVYQKISNYNDLIGKSITLSDISYTITAVIDTGFDIERYESLTVKDDKKSDADKLLDFVLYNEFSSAVSYGYTGTVMVGSGKTDKLIENAPKMSRITNGYITFNGETGDYSVDSNYLSKLSDVSDEEIVWLDGERKTLGEKEIIACLDTVRQYGNDIKFTNDSYVPETEIDYKKFLTENNTLTTYEGDYNSDGRNVEGYKIVGYIDNVSSGSKSKLTGSIVCSDSLYNTYTDGSDKVYSFIVGAMPKQKDRLTDFVKFCYNDSLNTRYQIKTSVTYELDAVNDILKQLSVYFLWIGVGFAAFAALMLANFIGTSISYKKQEIGILRAIGSRSNDVFRIFFSESFIIASVNFILSSIGVFAATQIINYFIRSRAGILITVLNFGPRQLLLLLAVSLIIAFASSLIPVKRIASKRPIDAIRDR